MTSSIPLSERAFDTILQQAGSDPLLLNGKRMCLDQRGVAQLERYAHQLDPVARERLSRVIERGPQGDRVKKARGCRCQICEAIGVAPISFVKRNGAPYAEAHHVQPVSHLVAGSLSVTNIMVLCPNHHRQVHHGAFDVLGETTSHWLVSLDGQPITIERTSLA